MRVLYCRVGWQKFYEGYTDDKPIGGGGYNVYNIGHESFNFKEYDGKYYGFVQANGNIAIEKIDNSLSKNDEYIEDVLIVWCSKNPEKGGTFIVGWYKNATVYREHQAFPDNIFGKRYLEDGDIYNILSDNCVCVSEERRDFPIKHMGRNLYYFGEKIPVEDVLKYIEKYEREEDDYVNRIESIPDDIRGEERIALTKQRVNQSVFRERLLAVRCKCALCNIDQEELLIASHIKPWSECNAEEKLDIENGLLLCPNHDKLFDKGYISFDNKGKIVVSSKLKTSSINGFRIDFKEEISISEKKSKYMKYHRENIFKK
ncbi:MAG: hypothetical protein E7279_08650 [Lachnospiraceae bacterium]|nr:hypothetical protein [Lachnospiraceae bacterium]